MCRDKFTKGIKQLGKHLAGRESSGKTERTPGPAAIPRPALLEWSGMSVTGLAPVSGR